MIRSSVSPPLSFPRSMPSTHFFNFSKPDAMRPFPWGTSFPLFCPKKFRQYPVHDAPPLIASLLVSISFLLSFFFPYFLNLVHFFTTTQSTSLPVGLAFLPFPFPALPLRQARRCFHGRIEARPPPWDSPLSYVPKTRGGLTDGRLPLPGPYCVPSLILPLFPRTKEDLKKRLTSPSFPSLSSFTGSPVLHELCLGLS